MTGNDCGLKERMYCWIRGVTGHDEGDEEKTGVIKF